MAPTADAKQMSELSMLTILIQVAAAVKNRDGDTSLHRYLEDIGFTSRRVMEFQDVEADFTVLDSIADTLLQKHQILAISPGKLEPGRVVAVLMADDPKFDLDMDSESLAGHRISMEKLMVSSISAAVMPNPDDCGVTKCEGDQLGPLGNMRQVADGISRWEKVKEDPLFYAVG